MWEHACSQLNLDTHSVIFCSVNFPRSFLDISLIQVFMEVEMSKVEWSEAVGKDYKKEERVVR